MAHPHHEHRDHKVQHRRVAHITKGYAAGGAVHSDEAEDRAMVKKMVKPGALKVEGGHAKHRADKPHRARGGRTKKGGKTVVNVIAGGGHPQGPGPMPMAAAGPPPMPAMPAMPPRPMPPPPGPMPGGPPGMPPGMPPRKAGGRAYAKGGRTRHGDEAEDRALVNKMLAAHERKEMKVEGTLRHRASGGRVKSGPAWEEGRRAGTQVTHSSGKNDQAGLNRGRQITYARGGKVEASDEVAPATKLPGGSGGGEARLFKERRAERNYKRA